MAEQREYDLVSLGEALLRMSPPMRGQLRRASSLEIHLAGAQMNVAADSARIGGRTAFISAVPDNPMGLLSIDIMASFGIDTSLVKVSSEGIMGMTFVEFSAEPRAPKAIYFRKGSSASMIRPDDFDWKAIVSRSHVAYTDGIFPGLETGCFAAALEFLKAARKKGCLTAFDCNYREHIFTPSEARSTWSKLLPYVDVIVTNRSVSEQVFGYSGTEEEMLERYVSDFGCKVVCGTSREIIGLSRGAWKSTALADGKIYEGKRIEFEIVDRYGTGDAWSSGFIHGYRKDGVQYGLEFGNVLCALAHTVEGDVVHVSEDDVKSIIRDGVNVRVKR